MMYSIASLQKKIETGIGELIPQGQPAELYEPITYTMNLGGKRIRPLLVMLACDLFGGDVDTCLRPSMAIELFHNFTLLHDDIMDNAPLRRGKETVFRKWGTNAAILSGDTMFAISCGFLSDVDQALLPSLLVLFTKTAREVCEGQQFDMNFESQSCVSINEYLGMIRLKTSVLIGCSLKFGAILGSAGNEDAARIYSLGENLGLGFQLQDDLLDLFGSEKFGKEIGGDIVSNKKTFLYLKALELLGKTDHSELLNCFSSSKLTSLEKIEKVREIYLRLKVEEKTKALIDQYYSAALKYLVEIQVEEKRKEVLKSMIIQLRDRDY